MTLENLEKQEMLVLLGRGELLEKMEKLVPLVLLGPRVSLGREENRGLRGPLVFRVSLGLQDLLEKPERQEIKVFLENLELLAP